MARLSKEEQARREGMLYALKIAKEKGIDGLEEEIKMRGIFNAPLKVSREDLRKCDNRIAEFILIEVSVTLHDRFGFGRKRIDKFKEHFNDKCGLIVDDWTSWREQVAICMDELGMQFSDEFLNHIDGIEERSDK